jgi:translation initiation factor IF-2
VLDGRILRGAQARLLRGGQLVTETRIESLRRFKDDIREVAAGFECGIGLAGAPEFAEGDVIECFQMVSEASA